MTLGVLTSTDQRVLSRAILVVLLGFSLLSVFGWRNAESPDRSAFIGLFDIDHDLSMAEHLYTLGNTNVSLVRGTLLDPPVEAGRSSAIAFSVKLNLSPPFRGRSIDSQVREKLGEMYVSHLKDKAKGQLNSDGQADSISKKGFWIVDVDPKFSIRDARLLLVAGVSAKPKGGSEPAALEKKKPKIIREAVSSLCERATHLGVTELFLGMIGAGAAGVDKGVAVDSIISGVNDSAVRRQCPPSVVLVLWPEIREEDEKKEALRRARWLEWGELFRISLASASVYERSSNAWDYRRSWILVSQLAFISMCPFLSALIALRGRQLPEELTLGAVLGKAVKWAVIGAGFTVSQQNFGEILPVTPWNLALLAFLAFLLPFWDWHKLGETRDTNSKS